MLETYSLSCFSTCLVWFYLFIKYIPLLPSLGNIIWVTFIFLPNDGHLCIPPHWEIVNINTLILHAIISWISPCLFSVFFLDQCSKLLIPIYIMFIDCHFLSLIVSKSCFSVKKKRSTQKVQLNKKLVYECTCLAIDWGNYNITEWICWCFVYRFSQSLCSVYYL